MNTKYILMLAIMMGLITTILFYKTMEPRRAAPVDSKVAVVTAAKAIAKNQKVTQDMVSLTNIDEGQANPESIRNISEVVGQTVNSDIAKDSVMMRSQLNKQEQIITLSSKITPGYRAVTISVDLIQSVSNLIEPEDHIDVILVKEAKGNTAEQALPSQALLEDVRVLSVGKRYTERTDNKPVQEEYITLTLELKPEDALKLINASKEGKLQCILRDKTR